MFRHRGAVCFSLALLVAAAATPALAADNYQVDPIHSVIIFRIKHLDVGMFYGRFNMPQGKVTFDAQDPSKSSFQLQVKAQDFDSGNAKRDQHVRGPDFLNAKEFPTISFKSKSVKAADGDSRFEVTGDLTMHGQTKPVTAKLEKIGQAGNRIGFEGVLEIKRNDFGVTGTPQMLGDEIRLIVAFEAVK